MAGKFCVSLTCAKDDTDKATVAFVVANAAVGSDKETVVFLSTEGVRLSQKGYADDVREEGFMALKDLMGNFALGGGNDLRLRPMLQQARPRRGQPGRWRGDRRRSRPGGVPLRRQPVHHLLTVAPA